MKTILVEIYWEDKNYCCGWAEENIGAVLCTDKSIDKLKDKFEKSLKEHIESMALDGESVPEWLLTGNYSIEYNLAVSALLRQAEQFTTMAVISRVTGINQKLLSNYASSVKIPRKAQRDRIVSGLHAIGHQFLAVQ